MRFSITSAECTCTDATELKPDTGNSSSQITLADCNALICYAISSVSDTSVLQLFSPQTLNFSLNSSAPVTFCEAIPESCMLKCNWVTRCRVLPTARVVCSLCATKWTADWHLIMGTSLLQAYQGSERVITWQKWWRICIFFCMGSIRTLPSANLCWTVHKGQSYVDKKDKKLRPDETVLSTVCVFSRWHVCTQNHKPLCFFLVIKSLTHNATWFSSFLLWDLVFILS